MGDGTTIGKYTPTAVSCPAALHVVRSEVTEDSRIFPNPSNGLFSVYLPQVAIVDNIKVVNMSGQTIYEKKNHFLDSGIDIRAEPNGIYVIVLDVDGNTISQRVLKN